MPSRRELKQEAKSLLKGNWGKAIGLNILQIIPYILILFVLAGVVTLVLALIANPPSESGINNFLGESSVNRSFQYNNSGYFSNIFSGLISTLLIVGVNYTILDWLRTKNAEFSIVRGIFAVFTKRDFLAVIVLWIIQTLFVFFWSLLLIIPGIIKGYSYSQTYYIYKDIADAGGNEDLNYLDYVSKSRELMKGHKFELFVLQLSFIGWDLLSILTLGLGQIWIIPYKNVTYMAYYRALASQNAPTTNDDDPAYFEA